jgi:glycerol-3-phosphate acyltransferase PlsY
MDIIRCLLAIVIAYLLGSISFAYIITKLKTGKDIRTIGSGSAGTTNTIRAVGKPLGAVVMCLDILKGVLAAEIGLWLAAETGGLLAFVFVIIGHTFPFWLGFHGGKGVACGAGALLALSPKIFLIALVGFVICVGISGYVSLGSIVACVLVIISVFVLPEPLLLRLLYLVMACTVLFMHRANIKRLLNGTESKTFHKK